MKLLRISQVIRDLLRPGFSLAQINGFPYSEFQGLQAYYEQNIQWYTGEVLDEKITVDKQEVQKYPLQLNPLPSTCLKHAMALMGETRDNARPQVIPRLMPDENESDEENEALTKKIRTAEGLLNRIWMENFGRSMLMQNAITSQYMGGSVLGIRYVPWEVKLGWRTLPFRIERHEPQYFYGVPIAGDQFRLNEAWIVKPINWMTALQYGIRDAKDNFPYFWVEHWTLDKYSFRINDKPITNPLAGADWKADGDNRWGCVPFVYIPHIRDTEFWGESLVPVLAGLIQELNLRLADYGDAINSDSHRIPVMSGVTGTPQIRKLSADLPAVIDLGVGNVFGGSNGNEGKMYELHATGAASQPMRDLIDTLNKFFERDAFTPAITDGRDEGSQRSGETLNIRFWPLLIHTEAERTNWTDGLNWFTTMLLKMMLAVNTPGIDQEIIAMRVWQEWAPILPKDRAALINEIINRLATNSISIDKAIQMYGDIENIGQEKELIKEWLLMMAELKRKERPEPVGPNNRSGGSAQEGSTNQSGSNGSSSDGDE